MALLEVRSLRLSLEGKPILRGMNLSVKEATVHAVVGPNGAGKTTLAYAIMGLPGYGPDSGQVLFDGKDLAGMTVDGRARSGLTLAWQEPARFEGIAVREFLAVGAARKDEESLREGLERVALDPDAYLDRMVDASLSGGERKRVELASIVVMEPRLVILDEPDSGIDAEALRCIFQLLDAMRTLGRTVLLVTHSTEVLSHADTATLMCCGKDVDQGPAERILEHFARRCIPCDIHNPDLVER
jgi:Fe-S cluster assembly ATP-binding protein